MKLKIPKPVRPTWYEAFSAASYGCMAYWGLAWHNDWIVAAAIVFALIDIDSILWEARRQRELRGK